MTRTGSERLVTRSAGYLTVHDIARDGRMLLAQDDSTSEITALPPHGAREANLSWLDYSVARDMSADGELILFDETGEGGGTTGAVYLRKTDGSPAIRLGDGIAVALSPDKKWAITSPPEPPGNTCWFPRVRGKPERLTHDSITHLGGLWFQDGKRIVFGGSEPGHGVRFYVQGIDGDKPRAISAEGVKPRSLRCRTTEILSPRSALTRRCTYIRRRVAIRAQLRESTLGSGRSASPRTIDRYSSIATQR